MLHLAWIVPLTLLLFFVVSPRYRGDIAESRVRRILAQGLERSRYTILNDVVVPAGGGTIAIDHVVVSKFGIFVIESVHAPGWVSGTAVQDRWKRKGLFGAARFENPVHLNRLQAEALATLLGFPQHVFHRMVVLSGHKGFKDETPLAVVEPGQLVRLMRKRSEQLLDAEQAARALREIESARLNSRGGFFVDRVFLVRVALLAVLAGGIYLVFGDALRGLYHQWSEQSVKKESPELFHPDGRRKTDLELWEDSLRCAWSPDTGRCACYEAEGKRVDMPAEQCRELAERGSVLRQ